MACVNRLLPISLIKTLRRDATSKPIWTNWWIKGEKQILHYMRGKIDHLYMLISVVILLLPNLPETGSNIRKNAQIIYRKANVIKRYICHHLQWHLWHIGLELPLRTFSLIGTKHCGHASLSNWVTDHCSFITCPSFWLTIWMKHLELKGMYENNRHDMASIWTR